MKIRLVLEFSPEDGIAGSFHEAARRMESVARALRREADRQWAAEKERTDRIGTITIKEEEWKR